MLEIILMSVAEECCLVIYSFYRPFVKIFYRKFLRKIKVCAHIFAVNKKCRWHDQTIVSNDLRRSSDCDSKPCFASYDSCIAIHIFSVFIDNKITECFSWRASLQDVCKNFAVLTKSCNCKSC